MKKVIKKLNTYIPCLLLYIMDELFDKIIKTLSKEIVRKLGDFYNFDEDEALLILENKKSIPLPFNGVINEDLCKGIRFNKRLYTQCHIKTNNKYCNTCLKQSNKNTNNKPNFGNMDDRMKGHPLDYIDPYGKKVVPYANILKKEGITIDEAKNEAAKHNMIISEYDLIEQIIPLGRPKLKEPTKYNPKLGRPKKALVTTKSNDDMENKKEKNKS